MPAEPASVHALETGSAPPPPSHEVSIPAVAMTATLAALSAIAAFCACYYGFAEGFSMGEHFLYGYLGLSSGLATCSGVAMCYYLVRKPNPHDNHYFPFYQTLISLTAPIAVFPLAKIVVDSCRSAT